MTDATVQIDRIAAETIRVPIIGTAPLIVHRFAAKAKQQMLDAMQGKRSPKKNKDPQADYEGSLYRLTDGSYGFPTIAFKAATVGASRFYGKDVSLVGLRQTMFFKGLPGEDGQQLCLLDGEPTMREDTVRVGQGSDLRYRGQFWPWATTVDVTYVSSALTRSSVLSLIDAGGMGVGIGEWRPEKRGDFGTFAIDEKRDVEVIS